MKVSPSCARCRARKVKCTQERPACAPCLRTSKYKNRRIEDTICYYGSDPNGKCSEDSSLDQSKRIKITREFKSQVSKKRGTYKKKSKHLPSPPSPTRLEESSSNDSEFEDDNSDSSSSFTSVSNPNPNPNPNPDRIPFTFTPSETMNGFRSVYTPFSQYENQNEIAHPLPLDLTRRSLVPEEPQQLHHFEPLQPIQYIQQNHPIWNPSSYPSLYDPNTCSTSSRTTATDLSNPFPSFVLPSASASSSSSSTSNSPPSTSSSSTTTNQTNTSTNISNKEDTGSSWNLFRVRASSFFSQFGLGELKISLPDLPEVLLEPNDPSRVEREGGLEVLLVKEGERRML